MKVSIVFLEDYNKVALYSVEVINEDGTRQVNEYTKFYNRMKAQGGRDARQLMEIEELITEICEISGAIQSRFRREGNFEAIPSHDEKDRFFDSNGTDHHGLRLYCIRVSDVFLILLNGCSKTQQNPNTCEDCQPIFSFSQKVADAFYEALRVTKTIEIDERDLGLPDDSDEEEDDIILNL